MKTGVKNLKAYTGGRRPRGHLSGQPRGARKIFNLSG